MPSENSINKSYLPRIANGDELPFTGIGIDLTHPPLPTTLPSGISGWRSLDVALAKWPS